MNGRPLRSSAIDRLKVVNSFEDMGSLPYSTSMLVTALKPEISAKRQMAGKRQLVSLAACLSRIKRGMRLGISCLGSYMAAGINSAP